MHNSLKLNSSETKVLVTGDKKRWSIDLGLQASGTLTDPFHAVKTPGLQLDDKLYFDPQIKSSLILLSPVHILRWVLSTLPELDVRVATPTVSCRLNYTNGLHLALFQNMLSRL